MCFLMRYYKLTIALCQIYISVCCKKWYNLLFYPSLNLNTFEIKTPTSNNRYKGIANRICENISGGAKIAAIINVPTKIYDLNISSFFILTILK